MWGRSRASSDKAAVAPRCTSRAYRERFFIFFVLFFLWRREIARSLPPRDDGRAYTHTKTSLRIAWRACVCPFFHRRVLKREAKTFSSRKIRKMSSGMEKARATLLMAGGLSATAALLLTNKSVRGAIAGMLKVHTRHTPPAASRSHASFHPFFSSSLYHPVRVLLVCLLSPPPTNRHPSFITPFHNVPKFGGGRRAEEFQDLAAATTESGRAFSTQRERAS